jgi:hypothetical protein
LCEFGLLFNDIEEIAFDHTNVVDKMLNFADCGQLYLLLFPLFPEESEIVHTEHDLFLFLIFQLLSFDMQSIKL